MHADEIMNGLEQGCVNDKSNVAIKIILNEKRMK